MLRARSIKTGLSHHKLYTVWLDMLRRCFNLYSKSFKNYGGRGITVCEEWKNDFKTFYDWALSNEWAESKEIDRINNDGNYEPLNCHFVTSRQNTSNTRKQKNRKLPVGVYKSGHRFMTLIRIHHKSTYVGTFDTPEEAHQAYLLALSEIE